MNTTMYTEFTTKDAKKLLDAKAFTKIFVSERENCVGTILLMDEDSGVLLAHHLLFSRAGFRTIKLEHPDLLFTLFDTDEYDVDLIISNTDMQMAWVDCLAMIRKSYNAKPNLLTTPIIFYGELPSGHFDVSFPNVYFSEKPEPKTMLATALRILEQHKLNQ